MFCKQGKLKIFSKSFCLLMKLNASTVMQKIKNESIPDASKIRDYFRRSLLHISAAFGNVIISKYLLHCGCEVDSQDVMGNTPLLLAVYFGHWDVVKLLIKSGASRMICNVVGNGPIFYAMLYKNEDNKEKINDLLIEKIDDLNESTCTIMIDQVSRAKSLVQNTRESMSRALKHSGRLNLVSGHNIEGSDDVFGAHGLLLNKAIFYRDVFQVRLNLMYWADVKAIDGIGFSALHAAAACLKGEDAAEVLQLLLGHGCPIDLRNDIGLTAFHVACIYANVDFMRRLLDRGARPDLRDSFGRTVLYLLLTSDSACDGCRMTEVAEALWILHRRNLIAGCSSIRASRKLDRSQQQTRHHVLVKHLALVEAVEGNIHPACRTTLMEMNCCRVCYDDCKIELKNMKLNKIYGPLSFFNILVDSDKNVVRYAEDLNVTRCFDMIYIKMKFPIYCDLLIKRFDDGYARMKFVDKARKIVLYVTDEFTDKSLEVDHKIVMRIIDFLRPRDLLKINV